MQKHNNVEKIFLSIIFALALMSLVFTGATCEEEPEAEPSTSTAANSLYVPLDVEHYRGLAMIVTVLFILVVISVISKIIKT